jgi:hypothetical protein
MANKVWALDDTAQLARGALQMIDQNLMPGERPLAIVRGDWSSAMIGTDRRVFV